MTNPHSVIGYIRFKRPFPTYTTVKPTLRNYMTYLRRRGIAATWNLPALGEIKIHWYKPKQ